jgi:SH3 domain-containing YSC84-like protein 1
MHRRRHLSRMPAVWVVTLAIGLTVLQVFFQVTPASANDRLDATQLLEKARLTLQSFTCDEMMGPFRSLIKKAHGVLIMPQTLKAGFIIGLYGSSGSGVLLVRDMQTSNWSDPAFYNIYGASVGLQFGVQVSEVVLLIMTDSAVNAFMENSVKLGGDVGLSVGPVGKGVSADTANLNVGILSFARSKGFYGGVALDGSVVTVSKGLNGAFYGKEVSPEDILVRKDAKNPRAATIIQAVAETAAAKSTATRECTAL